MYQQAAVNLNTYTKINRFMAGNLCVLCAKPSLSVSLCAACLSDCLANKNACPICAKAHASSKICGECLNQKQQPITTTHALFQYHYPINRLIQQMKFKQAIHLAYFFGNLLGEWLVQEKIERPDCIIPVPLHPQRLRSRGYNQSVEIAKPLSKILGVTLDIHTCQRIRATPPQIELPPKKRKMNVKNAFSFARNTPYNHVLLVDDVITTGSTVKELAHTLQQANVKRVHVATIARTQPK